MAVVNFIRLASFIVFGIGAYLCWRRWNRDHYQPWQVVGIFSTVIAVYALIVWIIFGFNLPIADDLSGVNQVAANIAFLLGGLAIVYAATYEKRGL